MAAILYLSLTKIVWILKAHITSRLIYKHIWIKKSWPKCGYIWKMFDEMVFSRWVFLVCRLDKLLSWFSTQTSVVNFRYYLFCLCNVRWQYLLPGISGIYCFLTGVPSLPAIALPKGRICSLVNQVYTSFPLMSLPPFGLHWPNVG